VEAGGRKMATPLTDDALRKYGASRNFLPQVSAL